MRSGSASATPVHRWHGARRSSALSLFAGGALAWLLRRRGLLRAASFTVLAMGVLGIGGHAAYSGLGLHAVALSASCMTRALAGLTVLVAEDNPVNMLIVCALLQRLGASVIEAEDGAKAVALATAAMPKLDAVLLDLHMPVQDGLAAARQLRARQATAKLPLMALSAAVLEQERGEARAAGMTEFLSKPVSEADLLRVLAPLVKRS